MPPVGLPVLTEADAGLPGTTQWCGYLCRKLPPVRVELTSEAVDHLHANDDGAGAVVTFLGVTRADRDGGRTIVALEYEAYDAMAVAAMRRIVGDAAGRFGILDAVVVHRLGRVAVGEASVVVSVACAHRAEAFAACAAVMDALKAEVPVWKRDVWDDGGVTWTPPNKEWRGDC